MTQKPAKMLHIEISVDDEVVEELRADGLIIATPSGLQHIQCLQVALLLI